MNRFNFVLERVSGPDIEVVSLDEMKRHLRCFDNVTGQDDDVTSLITAAREWAEDFTGRALVDQEWRLTFGDRVRIDTVGQRWCGWFEYRAAEIYLRRSPALAITGFVSVDAAGAETDVDATTYELREADSKYPRVVGLNAAQWSTGTYRMTFRAGYADRVGSPQEDASVVPERFKWAMKLWAEANFNRDKDMMDLLTKQAENLLRLERCHLQLA